MDKQKYLLHEIAQIGRNFNAKPFINKIEPFSHLFNDNGDLLVDMLNNTNDSLTNREMLTRYLLLNAVLDQGPDMEGVKLLLIEVTNELYKNGVRIFHEPIDFFKHIGIAVDKILLSHSSVKQIRSELWAKENRTKPDKYNLFMDNSKQVLNYAVFRWGVPLSLPLLLARNNTTLVDYLEKWSSGEIMSQQLKNNYQYGLGKAIGNKAAHLFAKWYIHSFQLVSKKNHAWGKLSFELPLDSNVGRVLFRSGWLLAFSSLSELEKWQVIQKGKGKGGTHYIRVTNLRGNKSSVAYNNPDIFRDYINICRNYLKTQRNPRSVEIQRIPNTLLVDTDYGIGDLDDGLMHIGTNYCLNHDSPICNECPIQNSCSGRVSEHYLIKDFRT